MRWARSKAYFFAHTPVDGMAKSFEFLIREARGEMQAKKRDALITSLYDAGLEPERWSDALLKLGAAFEGLGGQFFLWDANLRGAPFSVMAGAPPGIAERYVEYYGSIDPKLEYSLRMPAGEWLLCNEVFDQRFVSQSEFYQDFFVPSGGRYVAGTRLLDTGGQSALLGLFRPEIGRAHV